LRSRPPLPRDSKNVLNLTDDEIERIEEGKLQDKLADIRIEGATGEPVEPGTGGKGGGGGGGSLGGLGGGSGLGGSPGGDDDGPGGPDSGDAPGGGGGPEIDLSAPDLPSGGPDSGGGDESDSGEEEEFPAEEDLFSGRSLSGDLLTDVDEDDLLELDDDDEVILASRSGSAPLKVDDRSTVSGKAAYNRGRRRTHGAKALDQPDLARMVNHERPGDTMTDPFDSYSVNKLEGADPLDDFLNRGTAQHRRMTADLQSTLRNLKARMGDRPKVSRSVISEGSDGEEDGS
jgi:hypothetical protein